MDKGESSNDGQSRADVRCMLEIELTRFIDGMDTLRRKQRKKNGSMTQRCLPLVTKWMLVMFIEMMDIGEEIIIFFW